MSEPGASLGRGRVDAWLREAPRHELLPPRRRDAVASSAHARLQPLDLLPLGDGLGLAVAAIEHGFAVVPVAGGDATPRRAVAGDGAFVALFDAMRSGRRAGGYAGRAFGDRADGWQSEGSSGGNEVAIDVDQSNDSVIVGGSAVVKLFPFTSPGPQPGLDLPVHLASVGFTALPSPLGAITWTAPSGDDVVLATAAALLPGARDGWDWYLERLLASIDDGASEVAEAALEPAPVLGRMAAGMHAALATGSEVVPEPAGIADRATAEAWRREALDVAGQALELTPGDEGARLAARADAIRADIDLLAGAGGTVTTRVHGDFHVGQVLEWRGGYAVIDFDGNPMASASARGAFDTPARDVAAFVRSIDHLGRVASARRPSRDDDVEAWIASSRARFLDAYRSELASLGSERLFDERLLRPLEVAQECHEYVYAARFLPRWGYVPDLAMRAMFPLGER